MRIAITGMILCGLAATAAQAQEPQSAATPAAACKLRLVTSLDMTSTPDGVSVPVSVNGTTRNFRLDLATSATFLSQDTVDAMNIPTSALRTALTFNGQPIKLNAKVSKFAIGPMSADNQTIAIVPKEALKDEAGVLGLAVLTGMDFEMDFANHKLNLFSPDHCPGNVVYWTSSAAAQIPFEIDAGGHLVIAAQLEDKPVSVAIGSGANSLLPMGVAHDQFGLEESSTGMTPAPDGAGPAGTPASQTFNYRFKSLSASGVTLNNPQLVVYGPSRTSACNSRAKDPMERCAGRPDVNLGLAHLSKFHLYVSSKEKLIYLTAADAH